MLFIQWLLLLHSYSGGGSHSPKGANAPPTFGPTAPGWKHAPPTLLAAKIVI